MTLLKLKYLPIHFLFLSLLLTPVNAEWFSSPASSPERSAEQTAGLAPDDSILVLSWNLQGQLDLFDMLNKFKRVLAVDSEVGEDLFEEVEKELKRPAHEILSYFSGSGFLAVVGTPSSKPPVLIVMSLKRPKELARWVQDLEPEEKVTQRQGFHLMFEDQDDITVGFNDEWFFLAFNEQTREQALLLLNGEAGQLRSKAEYKLAFKELDYQDSGAAIFMDVNAVQSSASSIVGAMLGMAWVPRDPIWDYGVGAVDFKEDRADLILRLSPGSHPLQQAISRPGELTQSSLRKLPSDLSSFLAFDAAWYLKIFDTVAEQNQQVAMFYSMFRTEMTRFGDLSQVFSGSVVLGSDALDQVKPGSSGPTVVAVAELESPDEAKKLASKLTAQDPRSDAPGVTIYPGAGWRPSLRIDEKEKQMRAAWGPAAEAFLTRPPANSRPIDKFVSDSFSWAENKLGLVAFFDLGPIVAHWRAVDINEDSGSEEKLMHEFVRQFLQGNELRGVLAVKSDSEGMHYRIRGFATSPLIPSALLGGFWFWFSFSDNSSAPETWEAKQE